VNLGPGSAGVVGRRVEGPENPAHRSPASTIAEATNTAGNSTAPTIARVRSAEASTRSPSSAPRHSVRRNTISATSERSRAIVDTATSGNGSHPCRTAKNDNTIDGTIRNRKTASQQQGPEAAGAGWAPSCRRQRPVAFVRCEGSPERPAVDRLALKQECNEPLEAVASCIEHRARFFASEKWKQVTAPRCSTSNTHAATLTRTITEELILARDGLAAR
jgi:hypothetical protein